MNSLVIKPRGATSIEIKSRWVLDPSSEVRRERLVNDLHFFLPASFRITPETYERPQFYRDAKTHVRFDTPILDLEQLLSSECDDSPLTRLETMVVVAESSQPFPEDAFWYESKMLAAIFKSLLRRTMGGLHSISPSDDVSPGTDTDPSDPFDDDMETDQARPDETATTVPDPSGATIRSLHRLARRFHKLTATVLDSDACRSVHAHCRMIDEHISLLLERYLARYLEFVSEQELEASGKKRIWKALIAETEYRHATGYPTDPLTESDNQELEGYVYREKMLKRYASDVLFLRSRTHDESKAAEHLLYAGAAGIAMAFATAVGFYAQTVFGGVGVALFVLLVASYMVKDRLKDVFRAYFRRSAGGRFYDRRTNLYDQTWKRKLARVRERVSFLGSRKEDPAITQARARGPFEAQLARTAAESHFVYHKVLDVKAATLRRIHNRIRGFADIMILDLEPMLRHLAVQSSVVPVISDGRLIRTKRVQRVYHLNLVVDSTWRNNRHVSRFRLVVDRDGIKRIEPIPVPGTYLSTE